MRLHSPDNDPAALLVKRLAGTLWLSLLISGSALKNMLLCSHSRSARDVAAPAYAILARAAFAALERLAAQDAKHADRCARHADATTL